MRMRKLLSTFMVALALIVVGAMPSQALIVDVYGKVNFVDVLPNDLGLTADQTISGFFEYDKNSGTPVEDKIKSFAITNFQFDFTDFSIVMADVINSPLMFLDNGIFSGWDILAGLFVNGFDYDFVLGSSTAGTFSFDVIKYLSDIDDPDQVIEVIARGDIAPVPEPGTFLLLGAGLGGLIYVQRRRKNA